MHEYTLHTDLYQINMIQAYWADNKGDDRAICEMYIRNCPFGSGYAVFAGLKKVIDYLSNLTFSESDIAYLRELGYSEDFLAFLAGYTFTANVYSVREGEIIFANEPLIRVEGRIIDCQLVETAILNIVNFQTLIATKASRIVRAIGNEHELIAEFGTRRAHEFDAAIWGARAAYIAGFHSTSNLRAGKMFGVPVSGTHGHSLVQKYRDEYTAFKAYAQVHKNCIFLVDTYDTIRSGIPNAIRVAKEMGNKINFVGIRLDSGNLTSLSKIARKMLDEAGFPHAKIFASNDLDEHAVFKLKSDGAEINAWGIGTKLITAFDQPSLGGVYKVVATENNGVMEDTIKLSDSADKITTPGHKKVYRVINKQNNMWEGDYITMHDENPAEEEYLKMFHPIHTYISKFVTNFEVRDLHEQIFKEGKLVYEEPSLEASRQHCLESLQYLWDDYKDGEKEYPVDLSQKCWDNKMKNIEEVRSRLNN